METDQALGTRVSASLSLALVAVEAWFALRILTPLSTFILFILFLQFRSSLLPSSQIPLFASLFLTVFFP